MSEEITLDDLDIIWMEDGLPCFFADREDICDIVESFGFNIYYLLANQEKEIKPSTSTGSSVSYNNTNKTATVTPPVPKLVRNAQLFKVVNNYVGRVVSVANPSFNPSEFINIEEECSYTMPDIPHVLIEKLDQFFRLVDAQHGTESIVMLTYDTTKTGPDGWGILVPDQTNTSVHCNYDPDSIAQIKPDHIMIVGSVHSHPGMAAYASGTDHADQADFDGLHITFGWQKSVNNGATQYHIELQMAGSTYKLNPEQVFEDYVIDKAPDPEVVGWTDKVKKVSPPSMGGTLGHMHGAPAPQQQAISRTQASTAPGTSHKNRNYIIYPTHIARLFEDNPDIDMDSIVVCESLESSDKSYVTCPGCLNSISLYSVYADNSCSICDIPLSEPDASADQLIWNMFEYCKSRNIPTDVALYLFTYENTGSALFLRLTPFTMDLYAEDQWAPGTVPSVDDYAKDDEDLTLCCSSLPTNCYCESQVLKKDLIEFDTFLGRVDIYDNNIHCSGCINYYDSLCPAYREAVVDYISNTKDRSAIHYEKIIIATDCNSFVPYSDSQDNEGSLYYP